MLKNFIGEYYILMKYLKVIIAFVLITFSVSFGKKATCQVSEILKIQSHNELISPSTVHVHGILGEAISASEGGRIKTLPEWENSQLITMFSPESRNKNEKMDWYGEHAGKWLYTAALAANRTGSKELKSLLLKTADDLVSYQEQDGYLGTYSKSLRITNNKISHQYSWDVWNLSYMVLGLIEVHRFFPNIKYSNAAKKIGELFLKTFGDGQNLITDYGTRKGISATIILDPVVELYQLTKDERYLKFCELIIKEIDEKNGLGIINEALRDKDMADIGDGKAYQLIWNLTAIIKLYRITGNEDYLKAVTKAWQNIVDNHLSIVGGPWGGIGKHNECFNQLGFWSPYGLVETCSIMAWIQLNRELLECCGEAKYAQEIEKSAYNALIGAQYPNGLDWCYFSFANGRRHRANFNECCPSSGAMALEELSPLIYSLKENGIACNVYTESEANIPISSSNTVRIVQKTNYPFKGEVKITLFPSKESYFPVFIRIPDWAQNTLIKINGQLIDSTEINQDTFFKIERLWNAEDIIDIQFPFKLRVIKKSEILTRRESNIYRVNWFSIARGPLVYAINGLIEGKDRERTFQLPDKNPEASFVITSTPDGFHGPAYKLNIEDKKPILLLPYYEAGGKIPGTWRLTWLQDKIDE